MGRLIHLASQRPFDASFASGPWARTRGLIGAPPGVLVIPSRGPVHTFGMRVALDVLFCDRNWMVLRVVRGLRPRRVSPFVRGTRYVVEAPAGTFDQIADGDALAYVSSTDR